MFSKFFIRASLADQLEVYRLAAAKPVSLPPALPAIIGHARASAFAPVSLAQVQ